MGKGNAFLRWIAGDRLIRSNPHPARLNLENINARVGPAILQRGNPPPLKTGQTLDGSPPPKYSLGYKVKPPPFWQGGSLHLVQRNPHPRELNLAQLRQSASFAFLSNTINIPAAAILDDPLGSPAFDESGNFILQDP